MFSRLRIDPAAAHAAPVAAVVVLVVVAELFAQRLAVAQSQKTWRPNNLRCKDRVGVVHFDVKVVYFDVGVVCSEEIQLHASSAADPIIVPPQKNEDVAVSPPPPPSPLYPIVAAELVSERLRRQLKRHR